MRKAFSNVEIIDVVSGLPVNGLEGGLKLAAWTQTRLFPDHARLGLEIGLAPNALHVRVQNLDVERGSKFDNIHTAIDLGRMPSWQKYRNLSVSQLGDAGVEEIENFVRTSFIGATTSERETALRAVGHKVGQGMGALGIHIDAGVDTDESIQLCSRLANLTLGLDASVQKLHEMRLAYR